MGPQGMQERPMGLIRHPWGGRSKKVGSSTKKERGDLVAAVCPDSKPSGRNRRWPGQKILKLLILAGIGKKKKNCCCQRKRGEEVRLNKSVPGSCPIQGMALSFQGAGTPKGFFFTPNQSSVKGEDTDALPHPNKSGG